MNEPDRFSSGEVLSAQKLNEVFDYARPPYAGVPASGSHIFGSQSANASLGPQAESVILVYATEDFVNQTTDSGIVDDVPSGLCDFVRLKRSTNIHENKSGRPFYVHDVIAEMSGSALKANGDIFYAVWNHDSKRWEVLSSVGGGVRIKTAKVIECLGQGWHKVEMCDWNGVPPAADSMSESESTDDPCDLCALDSYSQSESGGIDSTCETVVEIVVFREGCEETTTTAYAHTTNLRPMLVGGMIKMLRRSSIADSMSLSGSLSDSLSASEDDISYYDVVDGVWPLVSLPFPVFECCEDQATGLKTVRITSCTKVIVEGVICDGGDDPCDSASESV